MSNAVTAIPAAAPAEALAHFQRLLSLETDCADVEDALRSDGPGFVLVDVRGRAAFARAHVPGAVNIPHRDLTRRRLGP